MLALIAGVDRKKAFMLAHIAIISDLDVLLTAHRVYLHTVFIPVAFVLSLFLYNLKQRGLSNLSIPRGEKFLATLYYGSHILLDLFPGPVAILWPLTNIGYGLNVGITVSQQSTIPIIQPLYSSCHQANPSPKPRHKRCSSNTRERNNSHSTPRRHTSNPTNQKCQALKTEIKILFNVC